MATVSPTLSSRGSDTQVRSFAMTTANRDGAVLPMEHLRELYVTVTGTWGGATFVLQGSNDGSNWFTMDDKGGTAISLTADGGSGTGDYPLFVRPYLSVVGAGATLTAIVVTRVK